MNQQSGDCGGAEKRKWALSKTVDTWALPIDGRGDSNKKKGRRIKSLPSKDYSDHQIPQ